MSPTSDKRCTVIGRKPLMQYVGLLSKEKNLFSTDRRDISAFLNVPYARRPEESKRYKAPKSLPEPDIEHAIPIYEATRWGDKISTQPDCFQPSVTGSIDCLYLNIFVPGRPEEVRNLLPVLVYIHDGGFIGGNNDPRIFTPSLIAQYGVILVTLSFRLGLNGFLNLHREECPGNAGLKDQVKALEWIRDNIECFKGDPNNVTLCGNGSGATCVNLHLIAPASKDLFHKAIVQSGGVYTSFGYRGHRREQKTTLLADPMCRQLLFAPKDSPQLHMHAYSLLESDRKLRHPHSFSPIFGPSVETVTDEAAFLPEKLENMMEEVDHDKPVLAGITKLEGLQIFLEYPQVDFASLVEDDAFFLHLLKDNLRWSYETANSMVDLIRYKYFRPCLSILSDHDRELSFARMVSEIYFHRFYDNFRFGPQKEVHKNLYVYRFDYFSEMSMSHETNRQHFRSATHGDDIPFLFCPLSARECLLVKNVDEDATAVKTREMQQVMHRMCSMWTNFCRTGVPKSDYDPDVNWQRYSETNPCYLRIAEKLELKDGPLHDVLMADRLLNSVVSQYPTMDSYPSTPSMSEDENVDSYEDKYLDSSKNGYSEPNGDSMQCSE